MRRLLLRSVRRFSSHGGAPGLHFQSLGIQSSIVNQQVNSFPHIASPTASQKEFVPALLAGKDVFIKDETGTDHLGF